MSHEVKREHGINRLSGRIHARLVTIRSGVRFSLTLRIAMHYCLQLLRTTLPACLIISIGFGISQAFPIRETLRRVEQSLPDAGTGYSQMVLMDEGAQANTVQAEIPAETMPRLSLAMRTLWKNGAHSLCFLVKNPEGETVLVSFPMQRTVRIWAVLMLAVLAADIMRVLYFLHHRHRLDKRVLAPIRDMTEMAATLSASNLSNRINVAGTKNELQELAIVINSMLDRIERSYNSQKQFVSDASHELRTPIAVIQGYADMLRRWGKEDPDVLDEGIEAIFQETANMKNLVESLLFLARHDKKTLMMETTSFDLLDVAEEVCREAGMVTPEDHFELAPAENCPVDADRGMIKQVLRILVDNAVKYTPKGGTITIGTEHDPQGCALIVRDNGCGIAKEDLPKIFDRFYRADSARQSETGGHGLGLSIARIIVVAHNGKIHVRSKPGIGTSFRVVLPDATQVQEKPEVPVVKPSAPKRGRRKAS